MPTKLILPKSSAETKGYFSLRFINPVVRLMTLSDLVILSSLGLINPIFAVFVTENIAGAGLETVGVAQAIYLLAKSIFQIPAAVVVDKIKGERDDFWAILIGSIIFSAIPLLYLVISTPLGLYLTEFFYGLSMAIVQPAWNAIWLRHIDRGHEGVESGVYFTLVGIGSALTASLGGFIASRYGWSPLFIIVSLSSIIGSLFLAGIYKDMLIGNIILKKKNG